MYCPDFFYFEDSSNFYVKQEENNIEYPFLIRLNNSVSGKHTYLIRKEDELKKALENLDKDFVMGWNSSIDTNKQVKIFFDTRDDAIKYAKKNNILFDITDPKKRKMIIKSYADNFLK